MLIVCHSSRGTFIEPISKIPMKFNILRTKFCFFSANCEIAKPCASSPCLYGTCKNSDDGMTFVCTCEQSYEGEQCDRLISSCDQTTCIHGSCVTEGEITSCICLEGYKGWYL